MLQAAFARMVGAFPTLVFNRGYEYQQKGYVLHARLSDGLIKARVKGESNQLYNVHLDLKTWPGQPALCSCTHHLNCEHAAACLFELQAKNSNQEDAPGMRASFARDVEVLDANDIEWYSTLQPVNQDYFSYQIGILIDEMPVNILPLIIDLLNRWDSKTLDSLSDELMLKLPLGEGKQLKIAVARLKPLLRIVLQYTSGGLKDPEVLPLKKHQLLFLVEAEQALSATKKRWQATETLRAKLCQLRDIKTLPDVPVPKGLKAQLRDYQHQGLNWLQSLSRFELGGILADDMGLGKTIQTLAHLQIEKAEHRLHSPSLILMPTSLIGNWMDEARRFTPELKVLIFHGTDRHSDTFDGYDIVVSTYGVVQRDKKRFLEHVFQYLILDEAHVIKNARTKTTQIILQLQAQNRLCLTGTPLENHLGELWTLFHFLMPGFLGNMRQFKTYFKNPIEKAGDQEKKAELIGRIQPFLLRRTKNEVARELPPKTVMVRSIELTGAQRDLYEAIRLSMEAKVRDAIAKQGLNKSHIVVLDALLKLRQICCDPRLLSVPEKDFAQADSAKLTVLMELLDELIEEGRSVLVFSQFTSMLSLIETALHNRNYKYVKLTGQTNHRQSVIDSFQNKEAPLFLISLKAGGVGLNLTSADTVIHYDPWWNPAVEDQATDRTHRIGQQSPVFVYKLIVSGSVEEVMLRMQDTKRALVEGILSMQDSGNLRLTQEALNAFFKPLEQ